MNNKGRTYNFITYLLSFMIAVIVGMLTSIEAFGISVAESIIIGVLAFIGTEIVALKYFSANVYYKQKDNEEVWEKYDEIKIRFQEMAKKYANIYGESHGINDLFMSYINCEVDKIETMFEDVARNQRMKISSDYVLNVENVFDSFNVSKGEKILKITWPIDKDNKIFADQADARFFEVTLEMLRKKRIDKVFTLIIVENKCLLSQGNVKKLLGFFKEHDKIITRYITDKSFSSLCKSNSMYIGNMDIGIYGPRMLYITEQTEPEHVGYYYKDVKMVRKFTKLFDEMWESESISASIDNIQTEKGIELTQLLRE